MSLLTLGIRDKENIVWFIFCLSMVNLAHHDGNNLSPKQCQQIPPFAICNLEILVWGQGTQWPAKI
eukprot:1339074-Ditylum_brightwellii.AAC.1